MYYNLLCLLSCSQRKNIVCQTVLLLKRSKIKKEQWIDNDYGCISTEHGFGWISMVENAMASWHGDGSRDGGLLSSTDNEKELVTGQYYC